MGEPDIDLDDVFEDVCPQCGSKNVDYAEVPQEESYDLIDVDKMQCGDCGFTWNEGPDETMREVNANAH